jgi:hypothetical protein
MHWAAAETELIWWGLVCSTNHFNIWNWWSLCWLGHERAVDGEQGGDYCFQSTVRSVIQCISGWQNSHAFLFKMSGSSQQQQMPTFMMNASSSAFHSRGEYDSLNERIELFHLFWS